jgi:hypothetical protein
MDFLTPEDATDEQIQQMIELGIIPAQMGAIDQQMAQAQAVRNRQGPQGRDNGRVFVAANPLEHVMHAAQGIKAGKDIEDLKRKQEELLRQQVRGRMQFFDTPGRRARAPFMQDPTGSLEQNVPMPSMSF